MHALVSPIIFEYIIWVQVILVLKVCRQPTAQYMFHAYNSHVNVKGITRSCYSLFFLVFILGMFTLTKLVWK